MKITAYSVGEAVGEQSQSYLPLTMQTGITFLKCYLATSKKTTCVLTFDPEISLLEIRPEDISPTM